jgi:hypothetical protein
MGISIERKLRTYAESMEGRRRLTTSAPERRTGRRPSRSTRNQLIGEQEKASLSAGTSTG